MEMRLDPAGTPPREGETAAHYHLQIEFLDEEDDLVGMVLIHGGDPPTPSKVWLRGVAAGPGSKAFLVRFLREMAGDIEKGLKEDAS